MFATHFFESKILNTFNNVTATGVGETFVGLYLSNPTHTGQAGVEVAYSNYTRLKVTWTPPYEESGGIGIRNTNELLWPSPSQDVGQARFIGILDTATAGAGNMLLYGELTTPLDIRANQQPSIYIGDILYFIVGDFTQHYMTQIMNVLRGQNLPGFMPHLALFDGDPEETGIELSGGAYARPRIEFGAPVVQVGGQSQISSTGLTRFPSPTTTWGNWAWTGIRNAATSGEVITKLPRAVPEVIQRNYVPQVPDEGYRISLN